MKIRLHIIMELAEAHRNTVDVYYSMFVCCLSSATCIIFYHFASSLQIFPFKITPLSKNYSPQNVNIET